MGLRSKGGILSDKFCHACVCVGLPNRIPVALVSRRIVGAVRDSTDSGDWLRHSAK